MFDFHRSRVAVWFAYWLCDFVRLGLNASQAPDWTERAICNWSQICRWDLLFEKLYFQFAYAGIGQVQVCPGCPGMTRSSQVWVDPERIIIRKLANGCWAGSRLKSMKKRRHHRSKSNSAYRNDLTKDSPALHRLSSRIMSNLVRPSGTK